MAERVIIRNRRTTRPCVTCGRCFECSVMATRKRDCDPCGRRNTLRRKRAYNRRYRDAR